MSGIRSYSPRHHHYPHIAAWKAALFFLLIGAPIFSCAQTLFIEPKLIDSSDPVQEALSRNAGRASTTIEGRGGTLAITYVASEPIEIYMVPIHGKDNSFVPTDFLAFTLPATDEGDVRIDLTRTPSWAPGTQTWMLHLLTKDEYTEAGFRRVEFIPLSPVGTMTAAIRQLFTPEPYTPSSYHALRGNRVFGVPVTIMFGLLTVIAALCALLIAKKYRLQAMLAVLIIASGIYQLRFSIDLLAFTNQHLREFYTDKHVYDEAGSAHLIAELLRFGSPDDVIYVCRDGTNYKEKLLRYFAYPIVISSDPAAAATADFALIMDKEDWSLETTTENKQTLQTLHCNDVNRPAELHATFEDGSRLYRLF